MRFQWIAGSCLALLALSACSRQESGWRDAAQADTVASYQQYLQAYPAGAHAAEARTRIDGLMDEEAWANANRIRTPEAWQRYLGDRPDGRHAAQARRLLAAYMPAGTATPTTGEWSVQLGAYSSEAAAGLHRERLMRDHGAELDGLPLSVHAPDGTAAGVWRLRTPTLAEAAARDLCTRLRADGVDCVPVAD